MAEYAIVFARSARKELENLEMRLALRVLARIEKLSKIPRPPGVRKLRGAENLWRLRIADYRVVYTIDDNRRIVDVITVRHRSDAYR
jgi:mRNA interferase RelE/StbE